MSRDLVHIYVANPTHASLAFIIILNFIKMYSEDRVKLHLELWQSSADKRTKSGYVVLVIRREMLWGMLASFSEAINYHLQSEQPVEGFFQYLISTLRDTDEKTFCWDKDSSNADLSIWVKKALTDSKIFCSGDGCQMWTEIVALRDISGLASYEPVQCLLAECLFDRELLKDMRPDDLKDYNRIHETLRTEMMMRERRLDGQREPARK
jgi:hypothetical protein